MTLTSPLHLAFWFDAHLTYPAHFPDRGLAHILQQLAPFLLDAPVRRDACQLPSTHALSPRPCLPEDHDRDVIIRLQFIISNRFQDEPGTGVRQLK